jgi:hypothetical protein
MTTNHFPRLAWEIGELGKGPCELYPRGYRDVRSSGAEGASISSGIRQRRGLEIGA